MAVGLEWAHAEFVGQFEGVAEVTFCPLGVGRLVAGGNLADELSRFGLVASDL